MNLLHVDNLHVTLHSRNRKTYALRGINLSLKKGESLALVGESGCGKSMTASAIMGLLPGGATTGGSIGFDGQSLLSMAEPDYQRLRGNRMAMIAQNPMSALNPTMRIGDQVAEPLRRHRRMGGKEAWRKAEALLQRLEVPDADRRMRQYPHQFSGGMLQRVVAAMAVACGPDLLIADEPTTALDVTVQAQLLALLRELQREMGMALLLISHDLAVVAQVAERVAVMYAGEIVEQAPVHSLFHHPQHPYTQGLKAALPAISGPRLALAGIPGTPPDLQSPPVGCAFAPRCGQAMQVCQQRTPPLDARHDNRCWLPERVRIEGVSSD